MKRIFLAMAIILIILGCAGWSLHSLYQFKNQGLAMLDEISNDAKNGRLETAAAKAEEFRLLWRDVEGSFIQFIRRDPLEQITSASSRLPSLGEYGDLSQFLALVEELKTLVEDLWEDELPLLHNII